MKLLPLLFIWTLSTLSTKGGEQIKQYSETAISNDSEIQQGYSVRKKEQPKKEVPFFSLQPPKVVIVSHNDLQLLYRTSTHSTQGGEIYGFTPTDKTLPIFISDKVSDIDNNPFHASIVVHEIVHYIQRDQELLNENTSYSSQVSLEHQAKRIQCLFLEQHGVIRQDIEKIVKC